MGNSWPGAHISYRDILQCSIMSFVFRRPETLPKPETRGNRGPRAGIIEGSATLFPNHHVKETIMANPQSTAKIFGHTFHTMLVPSPSPSLPAPWRRT